MNNPAPTAHRHSLRVYFEDTDAGGIVYHARFLAFAERARTESLRDLGIPHQRLVTDHGQLFIVRRVVADFLSPARLDDLLTVVTTVRAIGGASVTLSQIVESAAGTIIARLEVLLVCVQMALNRPVRLPAEYRDALAALIEPQA